MSKRKVSNMSNPSKRSRMSSPDEYSGGYGYNNSVTNNYPSYVPSPPTQYSQPPNRTIYLGNVDPETTYKELIDKVKGGMVEQVRILPEKKCAFVRFIDATGALTFYQMNSNNQMSVHGRHLKVGWGKSIPLRPEIASAVARGASRNVFIGQADNDVTEESLAEDFKRFGDIDKIDVLQQKQIAFVHFTSITAAIQAVEALPKDEKYLSKRVSYGRDRSAYDRKGVAYQSYAPTPTPPVTFSAPPPPSYPGFMGGSYPGYPPTGSTYSYAPVSPPSPPQSSSVSPMYGAQGGELNRTVYIGGLHADTSYTELLDVVRGGAVASCKMLPEKNCAFVTFVDPESALSFHHASMSRDGLTIHGQKIKVGWGKPAPIPPTVVAALQRAATRNVYLGGIETDTITESKLETDLSQYGTVEKVNIVQDKQIAFVNFTSIQSAVKAVAALRQDPAYTKYKINYGKDRCARN